MSIAHGGFFSGASKPMKRPRKRSKLRSCAVGRNTAFAFVRRSKGKEAQHRKIQPRQMKALRRLNATFVESIPETISVWDSANVGWKDTPSVGWIDVWRVPVCGHTLQELQHWCKAVGIDGPHYAVDGKYGYNPHAVGREMRVMPAQPGDNGFTERHLPERARRRAHFRAIAKESGAKGDFPALLLALGVTLQEVRATEHVELRYIPKQFMAEIGIDEWPLLCARQPDFSRLFRLMMPRKGIATANYLATKRRDTALPDYWPVRKAAFKALRIASERDQHFSDWMLAQPGIVKSDPAAPFEPTKEERRAIADGTPEKERQAILARLFGITPAEQAALSPDSPYKELERERAEQSVKRKRQRRAALSNYAATERNRRLAKRLPTEERQEMAIAAAQQRQADNLSASETFLPVAPKPPDSRLDGRLPEGDSAGAPVGEKRDTQPHELLINRNGAEPIRKSILRYRRKKS